MANILVKYKNTATHIANQLQPTQITPKQPTCKKISEKQREPSSSLSELGASFGWKSVSKVCTADLIFNFITALAMIVPIPLRKTMTVRKALA
tara:strand:- start:1677 stop:1955 length:279 start_codon:yes stop_codon:yes gene_type:complete